MYVFNFNCVTLKWLNGLCYAQEDSGLFLFSNASSSLQIRDFVIVQFQRLSLTQSWKFKRVILNRLFGSNLNYMFSLDEFLDELYR